MRPARATIVSALAPATALVLVGLLVACGARTDVPSATSETTGPTEVPPGSTPVGSTGETPIQPPGPFESPQDACMMSNGPAHTYSSEADLQSLLVGRWMLCNPGTANAYWSAADVGLDLLADGRCYGLARRGDTQLVRDEEEDHVWRYSVVPGNGQAFDMVFVGGGDPTIHSKLQDDPRKLVLDDGKKKYVFAPAQ